MGLDVDASTTNLELDTQKDIALVWLMIFPYYLLNEVDLKNHDPSIASQVYSSLEKWGELRLKRFQTDLN